MALNEEIVKNPTITTVATTTTYLQELQPNGTHKQVPQTTISKTPVQNPRITQVETNNENLKRFRKQQDDFTLKKMDAEQDLRKELSANTGFLEELNAMLEIVSTRKEALIFYLIIFAFLISLELFVVTSKLGDKKCDYDLIVEHQLNVKVSVLEELAKSIAAGKKV